MLHVACCLWDANDRTFENSRCFDEGWVEKLYRGFKRNLSLPFRFVCFTDRTRTFAENIGQELLVRNPPDYGSYIEPFKLNEPTIIVGLDTIIVANIDSLANYCLHRQLIALPRDPYRPERSINASALVPKGHRHVYDNWRGENDMEWLRTFPWVAIDDLWPGKVVSLKAADVRRKGLQKASIVYMHGRPKAHELMHLDWVKEHWR